MEAAICFFISEGNVYSINQLLVLNFNCLNFSIFINDQILFFYSKKAYYLNGEKICEFFLYLWKDGAASFDHSLQVNSGANGGVLLFNLCVSTVIWLNGLVLEKNMSSKFVRTDYHLVRSGT